MKVLLIHQAFVSPDEAGGTRHYELAKHMVQNGHQFRIVASDLSYLTGHRVPVQTKRMISEQVLGGVRILRAYTYPALHRSFIWRVFSFFSFMFTSVIGALCSGPVDVVMGTTPPIFQAISAWFVSALRRRPFLLEIRDLWPEFAIDMGVLKNPILIKISRMMEHFLYSKSTHILVNSPAYRDCLINKGIASSKISLIPNGVDPEVFAANVDGAALRKDLQLNGKFIITYAGALGMANDISTVLRAAELLKNESRIHFLLVGDGKERANLETLADELGLSNVTFAGAYPKSQMDKVLAASDACLAILMNIPMFRTTYPNKVFDYMAAGKPVLLAIDGVIHQVVEASECGIFVPPGDAAALATAAKTLCNDPELAKRMGDSGRSYVFEHFNRDKQAEDFEQLVKGLVVM